MYFLTSTWWVSRLCPWGHSATVQFSLKVNLALGPTATGHSTIPARMLHTIVTLSTGWANCARVVILALSGISSFTVHVCSRSCTDTAGSAFPGSVRLSEQCGAPLSPGWKSDANFRKQGLSHCRAAAGPNAQPVLVQVEAPGIWGHVPPQQLLLIGTSSFPGDTDKVPMSHCQPAYWTTPA